MTWTRLVAPRKRFIPSALWSTKLEYTDDTDTTAYSSGSVTIPPGVYLLAVFGGATFPDAVQGAVSAFGATWELVSETYYANNGGTESRRMSVWRMEIATHQTDTVDVTFSATQLGVRMILVQLPGARSGSNGADAIVQAVPVESDTAVTSLSATLAAFQDPSNYTLGFISRNNSVDATPGSGFVLIGSALGTTPATALNLEAVNVNDTTVDFTWAGNSKSSVIGIEVRYANVAPSAPTVDAGSGSDRGHRRESASALVVVAGVSTDRARGRQTATATVTTTGQSQDRGHRRESASALVVTSGQSADRGRSRATATGTPIVVGQSADRGRSRSTATGTPIVLGQAQDRARTRAAASALVTTTGQSADRGRAREAANGAVAAATVDAGASSDRARTRQVASALVTTTGSSADRARRRDTATATVTTTAAGADRTRGRETAAGVVPAATVDAGLSADRGRSRQAAEIATLTTVAFSHDRVRAREVAVALAIIAAGSGADRSRGREHANGAPFVAPTSREISTQGFAPETGATQRAAEVGTSAVTPDLSSSVR